MWWTEYTVDVMCNWVEQFKKKIALDFSRDISSILILTHGLRTHEGLISNFLQPKLNPNPK
jgi:hypothetical protein